MYLIKPGLGGEHSGVLPEPALKEDLLPQLLGVLW